jgi:hypothetical protein
MIGKLTSPAPGNADDPPPAAPPELPGTAQRAFFRVRQAAIDTNLNGADDWYELLYGYNPFADGPSRDDYFDPFGDAEADGLMNYEEFQHNTDPTVRDTDGDFVSDGEEIHSIRPPWTASNPRDRSSANATLISQPPVIGWSQQAFTRLDPTGPYHWAHLKTFYTSDEQGYKELEGSDEEFGFGLTDFAAWHEMTARAGGLRPVTGRGAASAPYSWLQSAPYGAMHGNALAYGNLSCESDSEVTVRRYFARAAAPADAALYVPVVVETYPHRPLALFDGILPQTVKLHYLRIPAGENVSDDSIDIVPAFDPIDIPDMYTYAELHVPGNKVEIYIPTGSTPTIGGWPTAELKSQLVRGIPGSADENTEGWLLPESKPRPEVELKVEEVSGGTDNISVRLKGTVKDPLYAVTRNAADRASALRFIIRGEEMHSLPLTAEAATGQHFDVTIEVPACYEGSFFVLAETTENGCGLTGWDRSAVFVALESDTSDLGFAAAQVTLHFPAVPTDTQVDTMEVEHVHNSTLTLTETAQDSGIYTGTFTRDSVTRTCRVTMDAEPAMTPGSVEVIYAMIELEEQGQQSVRLMATWKETAANSRTFANPSVIGTGGFYFQPHGHRDLPGSHSGHTEPVTVRVISMQPLPNGARISVGGTEFPVKTFTRPGHYYPYDPADDSKPRLFLPSAYQVPGSLSVPGFTPGPDGASIEFKFLTGEGEERPLHDVFTDPETGPEEEEEPAGSGIWAQPGDEVTMEEMLLVFSILYGDEGAELLGYFQAAAGTILLKNEAGDLDVELDSFEEPEIIIEKNDPDVAGETYTPVGAARLLFKGLKSSLAHPAVRRELAPEDWIWWHEGNQELVRYWAETAVGGAELYIAGILCFSEGADIILSVSEAVDGKPKALIGCLPFVNTGMVRHLDKTEGNLIIRRDGHADEILEPADLQAFKEIDEAADSFLTQGTVMARENFSPWVRKFLASEGGTIRAEQIGTHGKLRRNMEKLGARPGKDYEAHHDFPWKFLRTWKEWGINPNDAMFGRWIIKSKHHSIHGKADPGKFNDWWQNWITQLKRDERVPSRLEILQKLQEARQMFPSE